LVRVGDQEFAAQCPWNLQPQPVEKLLPPADDMRRFPGALPFGHRRVGHVAGNHCAGPIAQTAVLRAGYVGEGQFFANSVFAR
jgi:hypothetical protein